MPRFATGNWPEQPRILRICNLSSLNQFKLHATCGSDLDGPTIRRHPDGSIMGPPSGIQGMSSTCG
eukprot:6445128-Pyramimonas_sp.AAC.1